MEIKDYFKIGYIAKTHGLKGEVTIMLDPDCPDLEELKSIFVQTNQQLVPHFIETVSIKGVKAYLKFEDVSTLEQSTALKGSSLFLAKSDRPKLQRGEFYNDEVVGFEVSDVQEGPLGDVFEVQEAGPNRYLMIMYLNKEVMIPLNGPFIKSVNKSKKKILVELPDGFLEI
ncbi:MAG: 16S rRNA processing protein RimM [Cyclobacteriaceae bacterium]|nr:16S rRNA processing protein RimM [Cyclobacteriaceae bacterium]